MTAQTTEDTTAITVTQTGEPWEPRTTEVLKAYPEQTFNQLLPTVSVRQVNPYLVPDIEVVQLNPDPEAGDIYHDSQMKSNYFAPTAKGLAKLAQVAGITTLDSRRMDDGRDPDVVEWRVEIEMTTPSGRTVRAFGTKRVDLHQLGTGYTPQRMAKEREHLVAKAETKAFNRAVRSILSLHGAYPQRQLAKPFAILRYVPDMSRPEVRKAFLGQLLPSTDALYGPSAAEPAQIAEQPVELAPEAPDEDVAPEPPADPDPDWTKTSDEGTATDDGLPRILSALKERAEASKAEGKATDAQREQLKVATRGLGAGVVMGVLGHVFDIAAPGDITAAQAEAILDEFESRGATFANSMREAAEAIDRSLPS